MERSWRVFLNHASAPSAGPQALVYSMPAFVLVFLFCDPARPRGHEALDPASLSPLNYSMYFERDSFGDHLTVSFFPKPCCFA